MFQSWGAIASLLCARAMDGGVCTRPAGPSPAAPRWVRWHPNVKLEKKSWV